MSSKSLGVEVVDAFYRKVDRHFKKFLKTSNSFNFLGKSVQE